MSLIYARATRVPPRDFASWRNPCGGNKHLHSSPQIFLRFSFHLPKRILRSANKWNNSQRNEDTEPDIIVFARCTIVIISYYVQIATFHCSTEARNKIFTSSTPIELCRQCGRTVKNLLQTLNEEFLTKKHNINLVWCDNCVNRSHPFTYCQRIMIIDNSLLKQILVIGLSKLAWESKIPLFSAWVDGKERFPSYLPCR